MSHCDDESQVGDCRMRQRTGQLTLAYIKKMERKNSLFESGRD